MNHGKDGVSRTFKKISSSTTTTIFTGKGTLLRLVIVKDSDGGTATVTDGSDAELFTILTDYPGTFELRLDLGAGCKITTTGFTGGQLLAVYFKEYEYA